MNPALFKRLIASNSEIIGRLILTSRQELEHQSIEDELSDKAKAQLTVLNEALRISDRKFKIDADGTGVDSLIAYLRN